MPTEPEPLTLSELIRRAADVADPTGQDSAVADLVLQFEDADEPVTAIQNLEERLAIAAEGADVDIEDPVVSVVIAVALYLAYRRDEVEADPQQILRLAARAEWKNHPPAAVHDWLAERGVSL